MELKKTKYGNIFYIYEDDDLVGIVEDPETHPQYFFVGDVVKVTDDGNGYICPGISHNGIGVIIGIQEDDTDHFFEIQMLNGESGTCKSNRLEVQNNKYCLNLIERAAIERARMEFVRIQDDIRLHRKKKEA